MAEIIHTVEQIEDMFREIVLTILNMNVDSNHGRVRFPWGSDLSAGVDSAPGSNRKVDVCYIYELPCDDAYNRQRDIRYVDLGGCDLTARDEHTDVHSILFVNYGPNAYDCARNIRDGLFRDDIRRILKQNHFAMVTDVPSIRRAPELKNGEWWNRVDFNAIFNEFIRRESVMPIIEEIKVNIVESGRLGLTNRQETIKKEEDI